MSVLYFHFMNRASLFLRCVCVRIRLQIKPGKREYSSIDFKIFKIGKTKQNKNEKYEKKVTNRIRFSCILNVLVSI